MENVSMTVEETTPEPMTESEPVTVSEPATVSEPEPEPATVSEPEPEPIPFPVEIPLTEVNVTDDNIALNVMVSFLSVAQRRGVFSLDESAKVWECVKRFIQK